jgi:hypothetical protein
LIDQVIRDDEHRLLSEAEALEFHRGRHERERFPGYADNGITGIMPPAGLCRIESQSYWFGAQIR